MAELTGGPRSGSACTGSVTAWPPGGRTPPSSRATGWRWRCDPHRSRRRPWPCWRSVVARVGRCCPAAPTRRSPRQAARAGGRLGHARAAAAGLGPRRSRWWCDTGPGLRRRPRWPPRLGGRARPVRLLVLPASPDGRDLAPRLAAHAGPPAAGRRGRDRGRRPTGTRRAVRLGEPARRRRSTATGRAVATLLPGSRRDARSRPAPAATWSSSSCRQPSPAARTRACWRCSSPTRPRWTSPRRRRILGGGRGPRRHGGPGRPSPCWPRVAAALGASVGATRVVTDAGWMGHERQIGTTGVVVDPELYLAFGVSGASQHTGGLGAPRAHRVSVNTDPSLPDDGAWPTSGSSPTPTALLAELADGWAPMVAAWRARRCRAVTRAERFDAVVVGAGPGGLGGRPGAGPGGPVGGAARTRPVPRLQERLRRRGLRPGPGRADPGLVGARCRCSAGSPAAPRWCSPTTQALTVDFRSEDWGERALQRRAPRYRGRLRLLAGRQGRGGGGARWCRPPWRPGCCATPAAGSPGCAPTARTATCARRVVIACDGVNSFLAKEAGLLPRDRTPSTSRSGSRRCWRCPATSSTSGSASAAPHGRRHRDARLHPRHPGRRLPLHQPRHRQRRRGASASPAWPPRRSGPEELVADLKAPPGDRAAGARRRRSRSTRAHLIPEGGYDAMPRARRRRHAARRRRGRDVPGRRASGWRASTSPSAPAWPRAGRPPRRIAAGDTSSAAAGRLPPRTWKSTSCWPTTSGCVARPGWCCPSGCSSATPG